MIQNILPVLNLVFGLLEKSRSKIAEKVGVPEGAIEKVQDILKAELAKDEKALEQTLLEIERARQHDIQTQIKDIWLVNFARGMVRPTVTASAFVWYVLARLNDIPLSQEDYALIGGILAFWFGVRPFEKARK